MTIAFKRGVLQCCTMIITPVVKENAFGLFFFYSPFSSVRTVGQTYKPKIGLKWKLEVQRTIIENVMQICWQKCPFTLLGQIFMYKNFKNTIGKLWTRPKTLNKNSFHLKWLWEEPQAKERLSDLCLCF